MVTITTEGDYVAPFRSINGGTLTITSSLYAPAEIETGETEANGKG